MPKQPGYRRPLIEAIEPRLLFSATADIAVFDDATHHHTDLATAAQQLDLEQVYLQQEQLPPLATEFAASPLPATELHNLVFIDTSVTDYQTLVKDILANPDNKNIELIYLNPQQDAITQITNTLNHYSNVEGIHILSHGDAGVLEIGNQILTDGNIKNYQQELIQWAKSLTEDADILLYGCNLAASPAGVSLMQQLGQLTGADIAASTDITGSKNANGDWQLEKNLGNIEHNSLIAADQHTQWQGDLGTTIYATSGSTASTQVLSPGQNLYQSFTYTSGNGTYSVDNIRMMLQKDAFAQAQTVTVELSASLNGAAIASNTVSSASLSTSLAWYSFNISGTTLTDGQTYYIKIKTSGNDGLVATGIINSDTYAGGSLFYDSLTPDANRELSFEVNAVTGNTAPVVNNPLVSQTATKGSAFTYTFAANSFTDADGDTLTYTAVQQLGAALPSWLTFDANTRTFSGTPTSLADVHPITVRVTASDGSGHSTYDDFVLNVSNRIEAENYGQTSGTSIEATSDSGGGSDLTSIDPADWAGYFNSLFGYTGTYHADWRVASTTGGSIKLEPYGGGAVYDTISVPNTGGAQNWVTVSSSFTMADLSTVDFAIAGVTGSVSVNWFELTQYDKPTVSRALVDQQVSLNVPFSYQFSNTAGSNVFESNDSLTYSATLSDGSALPSWLSFNAATRTFSGTQTNSDLGDLSVRVTATDTHGGSVYDDFAISDAVNNAPVNTVPGGQTLNEDGSITFNQGAGITGTYYNNKTLTGPAAGTRTDANIDFVWPADPGIGGIGSDNFSARWSGQLHVTETGNFQFQTASDDGVRVYVDGKLVIDNWTNHALETNNSGNIALTAGKTYSVVVEYYESTGDSEINLNWMTPSSGGFSAIPTGNASNMQQGLYLGNTISVSDIDAGSGNLQVTLSVAHGTLSLPTNSGLTFTTGDGTGDATMVFQGTKDDINSALAFLSYTPTANYNGSDSLSIITSDLGNSGTGGPLTDSDSIAITVNSVNDSPTGTDKTITSNEDSAYTFGVSDFGFNDPDVGDTISAVRIDSLPAAGTLKLSGVSVVAGDIITSANIGNLVFTPAANANGNNYASFTFSVRDQTNLFDAAPNTITLNISAVNDTPTVSNIIPDQNATQGSTFNFQFASNSFNDIDVGDTLSYTAQLNGGGALPAWLNFNAATRTFSGTPANADVGTISIDVTADDGNGGTVTDTFNIAIANINDAPTVANAIADQNATEDSAFNFQFASNTFNDIDVGNTLTYSAQLNGGGALPSWLNFNAATRTFSGTPANADVGTISIDVTADDGNGGTVTDTFNIVVANTNDAPTVANSIADQNATEDSAFNFQFASNTFNDVDVGNTLTYTAQLNGGGALPSWLNFNAATRTFSGTPANADVGTISIDVTADDGNGGTVTDTFNIVIANINDAPTVANSLADQNATEDSAFNFQFASNTFNDVDVGNTLTYTAQLNGGGALPSWLNFNAATRTFSGTPANADVGTIAIDVTADDGNGGTVTDTFNIVVANTNDAPTVANAIAEKNATEDSVFNFQFVSNTFSDVDVGNTLTYTAQLNGGGVLPSWLSFNAATRTFSGTPANADVGTISIDVTADDGNGGTVTDTFNIAIANINDAPTVANAIADQNATEDSAFNFQFASNTFNDIDVGNTLTYTAQLNGGGALPSWLNFNAATRTFSGTPANADVGSIAIDVTADDGNGGTVTDTFHIVVANTNDVPTVANAIADQNATEDSAFSFQFASNTFNDIDVGNTLTYTAQLNGGGALPSWLSFNAATQTFGGTPANADVGTISIDVTADDGNGGTVTDTFNIVVANTNDAPTVANSIADQNATEDSTFSFQFASNTFNDVDIGNTLTYTAQLNGGGVLPSWLSFNAATRTFSGTPANADVGTISIDVTADDGNGGNVTDTFNIVVANTNDVPTVANSLADQNATEDSAFSFQFASNTFNDVDVGNTLTYTAQLNGGGALPSWLSFNAATRTFSGTPANADVGTISIDVTADDGNGGAVTDTFNIVVANTNDAPTVANTIPGENATQGSAFSFQFAFNAFTDQDIGDTLSYSSQLNGGGTLPSWLSFDAATRTFSGIPGNSDIGAVTIDVIADDGNGGIATQTFTINVANANDGPSIANAILDQTINEDTPLNFQFASNTFVDLDPNTTLTYSAQLSGGGALPSWLSFNATTRTFSGTPTNSDVGIIALDVTADDGNGGTITDNFTITVINTNDAPTVANPIPDQTTSEGTAFNFQVPSSTFNDVDAGSSLSYSAQLNGGNTLPSWLIFDNATHTFSGIPTNSDVGVIAIELTADDGNGGTVTDTFNLIINNANNAPFVANALTDQNATEDSAFTFQIPPNSFSDVDVGNTLTYSATLNGGGTLPSWLGFDAATRTFSGTPTNADVGTIAIDVTADDGNGGTVTDTFNIMVANTNDAPIAINPIANQTAIENSPFRFQVPSNAFDDIDAGDSLTYSAKLSNGNPLPHWLQFDAATKTFTGTPAFADQGETVISVIATDNAGQSASSSFNLQIASLNEAPTSDGIMDIKTIQGSLPDKLDLSSIFSDREDGHALHYTIASNTNPTLISSIVFDAKTNFATLNYNPLAAGQADIVIRATDNNGAFVDTQFHLTIVPVPPKVEVPTTDTETVKSPLPSDANPIDFKPVETGTASQPAQETMDARHNESDNNGNKNSITPNAKEENHTGTIDVSHLNQVTSPTIDPIHLNPDKLFTTADDKFNPNRYDRIVQHETQLKKNNDQWLSHSAISSLILPYEGFSTQDLQELASELRKVHHDMDEAIAHENQQKMLVTGITLSITTGVIIWTLRASSLLLTLFSMLPLWRGIDPLPILQEVEKRKKQLEAQRKDKKMEDKNAKEVGYLFDNVNTKNPGDQG